jgi:hypothetical protein
MQYLFQGGPSLKYSEEKRFQNEREKKAEMLAEILYRKKLCIIYDFVIGKKEFFFAKYMLR